MFVQELTGAFLSGYEKGQIFGDSSARKYFRGAVYNSDGLLVPSSLRWGGAAGDHFLSANPDSISIKQHSGARKINGNWLYGGSFHGQFGHFIVETITSLWPLVSGNSELPLDGLIFHHFSGPRSQWQLDLIRTLSSRQIEIICRSPAFVEKLFVPTRSYDYQSRISSFAGKVWNEVGGTLNGQVPGSYPRVYLSAHDYGGKLGIQSRESRGVSNTLELELAFSELGFEVFRPHEHPISVQVGMAAQSSLLVGFSGSALHLSCFQPPGNGSVIELMDSRSRSHPMKTQRAISKVLNQPLAQIAHFSFGNSVNIRETSEALRRLID
jgi:capsular polysaccharide biosynthesis protein